MAKKKQYLDFEEAVFDEQAKAKNLDYTEVFLSSKVFFLVGVAAVLIAVVVFGRLFYLNTVLGGFYSERSEANVNKETVIPAHRGIITDRFGTVLAKNTPALSVYVNAAELLKPSTKENINEVISQLSKILDLPQIDLRALILGTNLEKQSFVLVERNITPREAIAIKGSNLSGVTVVDDYVREYVDGLAFAHIVGFTAIADKGKGIEGKSGLEFFYNDQLRGKNGLSIGYRDAMGNVFDQKLAAEAEAGQQIVTTIDAGLQKYFYNRLFSGLRSLGRVAGVGLAINPQNGEILSLVSLPSFDNNIFSTRGRNKEKENLLRSASQAMFNRAISGIYSPGSTIKPLVALAALRENIVAPDFQVYSKGYIEVPNPYNPDEPSRFLDWKPHGWVDLHSALARSSNVYFYGVGGGLPPTEGKLQGLGIYKLKDYWQKFGFGEKTGVDFAGESEGFLPDPEEKEKRTDDIWRLGDTYNVSIGQGDFLVTPLQLLDYITAIANGGKIFRPHFLKESAPEIIKDYSDWQKEIKEVQIGMEDAVQKYYGTANLLSSLPFKTAAKTGSAQFANNTKTNAFIVSYAPIENPEITILVLIENAREGSLNAVPIAKDVLEWYYFNRLNKKSI